jgi:hypothetical protein
VGYSRIDKNGMPTNYSYKRRKQMRRRFQSDPKWITVKYPAKCTKPDCHAQIKPGERAFSYPGSKCASLYGTSCGHGEEAALDFAAHRADEESGY